MSVRGFNTGSGIEQYDYDYLDNKPAAPTKESIGLGNVDNTSDMNKPVSTLQREALSQKVDKVPGMGLSQEDYTSEDKAKLEALPTNSELEADLAGKASAETVAALESAVNDPDNGLETKASAIINTASGAIASFSDGADSMPIKKLVVAVEPQQDLHGYDNPWPAGGGKNKLQVTATTRTVNGVTFTVNDDNTVLVNGTASGGNAAFALINDEQEQKFVDVDAEFVLSGCPSGGSTTGYRLQWYLYETGKSAIDTGNGSAAFKPVTTDGNLSIVVNNGTSCNNLVFKPMIRLATETDATFAPYSNICPISGWTGAEIEGRGKNWFDVSKVTFSTANGSGNTDRYTINQTANFGTAAFTLKVKPNTNYHLRAGVSAARSIYRVDKNAWNVVTGTELDATFQTGSTGSLVLSLRPPSESGVTNSATYTNIMLEEGTVATSYEPYASKEISVTFPSSAGTVYGATLTVNPDRTGTLVVEDAIIDMGTLNWNYVSPRFYSQFAGDAPNRPKPISNSETTTAICTCYKAASRVSIENRDFAFSVHEATSIYLTVVDSRFNDAQSFKSGMSGQMLAYPLAETITYPLSESEISGILETLYGTNNIWADCGDSTVEYTADTKLFIEHLTQPTEDDMTADHAISAGTFFMIGNSLYLATSQIAAGATITPGTNATKLSLADALNQLNT